MIKTQTESIKEDRLNLKVGSFCEVYSRSKTKWIDGYVSKIYIDTQTNQEWLVIKYGNSKRKKMQRFCKDLKPKQTEIEVVYADDAKTQQQVNYHYIINDDTHESKIKVYNDSRTEHVVKHNDPNSLYYNNVLTSDGCNKLVFGYIRTSEILLLNNSSYYNIPQEIIILCLSFLYPLIPPNWTEKFDHDEKAYYVTNKNNDWYRFRATRPILIDKDEQLFIEEQITNLKIQKQIQAAIKMFNEEFGAELDDEIAFQYEDTYYSDDQQDDNIFDADNNYTRDDHIELQEEIQNAISRFQEEFGDELDEELNNMQGFEYEENEQFNAVETNDDNTSVVDNTINDNNEVESQQVQNEIEAAITLFQTEFDNLENSDT